MPLYDFACRACGDEFEAFAPPGGAPDACPACGAPGPERRYSAPATLKIGLRGAAAQRSNADRSVREERRREGWAAKREKEGR
ncbi:MAG TPA: zinc ribbon domain-containing protein [Solirubrobacteraceae bacterium]